MEERRGLGLDLAEEPLLGRPVRRLQADRQPDRLERAELAEIRPPTRCARVAAPATSPPRDAGPMRHVADGATGGNRDQEQTCGGRQPPQRTVNVHAFLPLFVFPVERRYIPHSQDSDVVRLDERDDRLATRRARGVSSRHTPGPPAVPASLARGRGLGRQDDERVDVDRRMPGGAEHADQQLMRAGLGRDHVDDLRLRRRVACVLIVVAAPESSLTEAEPCVGPSVDTQADLTGAAEGQRRRLAGGRAVLIEPPSEPARVCFVQPEE